MEPEKTTNAPAGNPGDAGGKSITLVVPVSANPVVSCRIEGKHGAILFNPDTDSTLLIDTAGIVVWNFITQPRTIDEIVAYVTDSYSESPDPAVVRKDIETFIRGLAPDFLLED